MPVSSPEPHSLSLVIDFVNTWDADDPIDQLATTDGLANWLAEHDLGPASEPDRDAGELSERERRQAVGLREALRALMLSHNGAEAPPEASEELERVAARGQLAVRFGDDGLARIEPRSSGFAGALASLLVPVAEATADGSWQRVKACRAPECHWAFYDQSRNRSGVWCDMAVCGNRHKVRAYRSRGAG
jgi:predicted RNA-binding Zn ribbon-like protein